MTSRDWSLLPQASFNYEKASTCCPVMAGNKNRPHLDFDPLDLSFHFPLILLSSTLHLSTSKPIVILVADQEDPSSLGCP